MRQPCFVLLEAVPQRGFRGLARTRQPLSATAFAMLLFVHYLTAGSSPVGYESVQSLDNFFYTHAYSYMFGQAYTLWGGLLTVQLTKNWLVMGGLSNGWDTLTGTFNNINALYGVKYTPDCRWWWAFRPAVKMRANGCSIRFSAPAAYSSAKAFTMSD